MKSALGKLGHGYEIPEVYVDDELPEEDARVLAIAVNAIGEALSPDQQERIAKEVESYTGESSSVSSSAKLPPGQRANGGCGGRWKYKLRIARGVTVGYDCRLVGTDFVVFYNKGLNGTVDSADRDSDGVPDEVETLLRSADLAFDTYVSHLNYRQPVGKTNIFTDSPLLQSGHTGLALPRIPIARIPSSIHLGRDDSTGHGDDPEYVARHEAFHIVQYAYIPLPITKYFATAGIAGLGAFVATVRKSVRDINWWMEATAEWAAHQSMLRWYVEPPTRYQYAHALPTLFKTASEDIAHWDGFAGERQYGAFLLAEWIEERYGADFIRRTWVNVADDRDGIIDSYSDLRNTFAEYPRYDGSIERALTDFWVSTYQLCDGSPQSRYDDSVHFTDPERFEWCDRFLAPQFDKDPVIRPPHRTMTLAANAARIVEVEGGGAAFVEMVRPSPDLAYDVDVTFAPGNHSGIDLEMRVLRWADKPNDRCSSDLAFTSVGAARHTSIEVTPECPHVTVVVVNRRYGDDSPERLAVIVSATASAGVLLDDRFNPENDGAGALNYTGFANWGVTSGTVDLIGNGFFDYLPGHGLYVDLDGSSVSAGAGLLSTKNAFVLPPGRYRLSFKLGGSQRGTAETVSVSLGGAFTDSYARASSDPMTTVTEIIDITGTTTARLSFQSLGADNKVGALLDDVRLERL